MEEKMNWTEYDTAAEWCAERGYAGRREDPMPENLSAGTVAAIDYDRLAFRATVRDMRRRLAREESS